MANRPDDMWQAAAAVASSSGNYLTRALALVSPTELNTEQHTLGTRTGIRQSNLRHNAWLSRGVGVGGSRSEGKYCGGC